ncbi:glycoside hydrolase family 3 C-terminal domain-containing protein [Herbiconiux sp. YIM B11900]|uniref:glycoside hydrolase family 3 C-terminal domain-containing protein n=1 Tax=Herbiconiux sp. YIM B11900 TaxID=3404131 RepID=UPI003F8370E0
MTEMTPAEIVAQLTDAEKVALTAGADAWTTTAVPRVGLPSIRLGDGPHGVRKPHDGSGMSMFDSHPATCFPTAAALGSSWDPELVREIGVALGHEAAAHGVAVLLGPGVNLKRTPIGGRNFEYFAEDPLLSSRMGAAWVRGVQSTGIGASLKHFAANNTESRRYGVDVIVDERALREVYLASFEPIVRNEHPATVMAAYNRLNGEHCTENAWLLRGVLREEWGFDGVVVSDWGATWDRTVSIPAGSDLAMPGLGRGDDRYVLDATRSGRLPHAALDAAARRIVELVHRHGPAASGGAAEADLDAHHALARRAAAAGTVLLKNDGGVLPLTPPPAGARLALIGALAEEPRFQGAGSSHVVATRVDTLLESLRETSGSTVAYAPGYDRVRHDSSAEQLAEAVELARGAAAAIVVVGLPETFETEGVDREHLRLPEAHDRLVEAVAAVNPNTVVVLQNGSPVELPWSDRVPAIVEGYLGGQAGGSAMAEVLLGATEPGGRLAETFPVRYSEHPASQLHNGPATVEYRESLYVGYRYFDSAGERVAFPFGHGLSYTSFDWSEPAVESDDAAGIEVRLTVTNTGDRAGSEVVQLYVHDPVSSVFRPEQELRGFAKVRLEPGETDDVVLQLTPRDFSFWNTATHGWEFEPGAFELRLGRSSRDILWRRTITLETVDAGAGAGDTDALDVPTAGADADATVAVQADGGIAAYVSPSVERGFPADDFARLLGRVLPPNLAAVPGAYTLDTAISEMQRSAVGRILFAYIRKQAVKTLGAPAGDEVDAAAGDVVAQLTFRMFPTVSEGVVGRRGTRRLLRWMNRLAQIGRRH